MPQRSVFLGGRDAFLNDLARTAAERRLEEDRARQVRQDDEGRALRERQVAVGEGQLASIEKDRVERREGAQADRDARAATAADAQKQREALAQALDDYDKARTPEEKRSRGLRLINMGGKLPTEPAGFELSPGQTRYSADGKVIASAPNREVAGPKADPGLPQEVKTWIEDMSNQGQPIAMASEGLSKNWGKTRSYFPKADLRKASAYLMDVYRKDEMGTMQPLGKAPAPVGAPAASPQGGQVAPPPNAPQAAAGGSDAPVDEAAMDAKLAEVLSRQTHVVDGQVVPVVVTPEILAATKAAIQAGNPQALALLQEMGVEIPDAPAATSDVPGAITPPASRTPLRRSTDFPKGDLPETDVPPTIRTPLGPSTGAPQLHPLRGAPRPLAFNTGGETSQPSAQTPAGTIRIPSDAEISAAPPSIRGAWQTILNQMASERARLATQRVPVR